MDVREPQLTFLRGWWEWDTRLLESAAVHDPQLGRKRATGDLCLRG